MWKSLKETSGIAIFSFILSVFMFLIPFIDSYVPYPFPRQALYALLDGGGGFIALIVGIIALIHVKKTGLKGKWLAILGIILGVFAALYV